ncbi:MAG: histidine kinase [Flavobacteriaceae bacterium]|nr:MAG: histidine kinase [Flavobacteriaceae bacterium]
MENEGQIKLLVLVTTVIILLLGITVVVLFSFFQKKKVGYIAKQREVQQQFEEELTKSKIEIREQALQNISWEIHDNIGQLLSVARMQLNIIEASLPENQQEKISETNALIGSSLQELRSLAKSLSPEIIKNLGLIDSIQMEVERFNKLKFIKTELTVINTPLLIQSDHEIILFRIIQEFCNNTLKYSKGSTLNITLTYFDDSLQIIAKDNGIGFDTQDKNKQLGIGLLNMKSRSKLIGAKLELTSVLGKGTQLDIKYKLPEILIESFNG